MYLKKWIVPTGALLMCSVANGFVVSPQLGQIVGHQRPCSITGTSSALHAIADDVNDQMKAAMRAKETTKLGTIRLIRAAFANAAIEFKTEKVSDEQAVEVLRKMAKMRKESIDMFTKGGAMDRAEAEQAELDVLGQWLPQLASEEQTREWVLTAIASQGDGPANIGKVMGALMKEHKGEVEGSLAQKVVKEEVSKL